jgi:RNA polymerase sigma factor (sigma-70 family)
MAARVEVSVRLSTRLLAAQSDARLLELVAQGHERGFEVLVRRYRAPLLNYCRRMGLSDSRAEDALQQALLQAWMALEKGTEVRELRPWLYRIVHNAAVNVMRGSRDHLGAVLDPSQLAGAARESEPECRMAVRDTLNDVAALPRLQREAILLSAVEGRPHDEVAGVLGVSQTAVRGLLYRARVALRAAAAALTPAPLLGWASGTASRVAPTTARMAELTGVGAGTEVNGMLLKGATVAASAALAAGAVLAPPHGSRGATHRRATVSGAVASTDTRTVAHVADAVSSGSASHPSARTVSGRSIGPSARHGGGTGAAPRIHAPTASEGVTPRKASSAPAPAASAPNQTSASGQSLPAPTPPAPTAAAASSASVSPKNEGGTGGGSSGGSGGQSPGGPEGEGKHSESPGKDGSDDGSPEGQEAGTVSEENSGGSHSGEREHEREAQAAQERREQEAQALREYGD